MAEMESSGPAQQGRDEREGGEPEGLSKAGTAVVAVAYVTGLLATNIYLHSLGISDFSLLKPKTILTGALVIGTLALVAFLPLQFASRLADRQKVTPPYLKKAAMLLFPVVVLLAVTSFVRPPVLNLAEEFHEVRRMHDWVVQGLLPAVQLYISACLAAVLAVIVARFYRRAAPKQSFAGMSNRWAQFVIVATGCLLSLAWYSFVFSTSFYGLIPQQFGGGRSEAVRLQVDKDAKPQLEQLGIAFVCDTNITEALDVIHESEDSVAVLRAYKFNERQTAQGQEYSTATTVTQIDRKMIKARTLDSEAFSEALADWHHCPQANKPLFK